MYKKFIFIATQFNLTFIFIQSEMMRWIVNIYYNNYNKIEMKNERANKQWIIRWEKYKSK